jgi:hypothetical protein
MAFIFNQLLHSLSRFEEWFDTRFGWFFTNGMKEHRRPEKRVFRA